MLETYRVQIKFPMYGGDDQTATNTLYFRGNEPTITEIEDVGEAIGRVAAFYLAVDSILSSSVFGASPTPEVIVYRMSDPPPRIPIAVETIGPLTAGGGNPHPSDVAICLSFRGEYTSGNPRARKRGRIYLGPVTAATGTSVTNQGLRVSTSVMTQLLDAADLLGTEIATPMWWVQWSETDNTFNEVVEAWVNNQYDTRRSRDRQTVTKQTTNIVQ